MSGRYNNPPAGKANGWNVFKPQTYNAGKYIKYDNQIVVIIHVSEGRKKGAANRMIIPPAVLNAMGNPKRIKLLTRGSNVGLMGVDDSDTDSYVVTKSSKGGEESVRFLNTTAFIKQYNIHPGVYVAHVESGIVVFDTQSTPSMV